jgi:hypothetical protein
VLAGAWTLCHRFVPPCEDRADGHDKAQVRVVYDQSDMIQMICRTIGLEPLCGSVTSPWWCPHDRCTVDHPTTRGAGEVAQFIGLCSSVKT